MATETLPTPTTVATQLVAALDALRTARQAYLKITERWLDLKLRLQVAEDLALLGGAIDGKNEQVREAQLREVLPEVREEYQRVDLQRYAAQMQVEIAEEECKTYRALCYLLAGARD